MPESATTRSRHVLLFFAVAYGFSWLFWLPDALAKRGLLPDAIWTNLGFAGAWGPLVAALVLVAGESGRSGMVGFLKRGVTAVHFGRRWWLVVLLLFPAVIAVAHVVSMGAGPSPASEAGDDWVYLPLVFFAVLFTGGPLQEEFGWRGYALPALQQRLTPLVAAVTLGVVWAAWHIPQFLVPPQQTGMFYVTPFWSFVVTVTAASVVFAWVGLHTGGSILAALVLHTTMNLGFWLSPVLYTPTGPYWVMALFVLTAAVVCVADRRRMLTRPAGAG